MDNRLFWKTVKPLFNENSFVSNKIVLVESDDVLSNDVDVANTLNTFFSNAVRVLGIQDNILINIDNDDDIDNIILKIINAYENHLSIIAIKNHVNETDTFSIQEISENDLGNIITSLCPSKNVSSLIPSKIVKTNSDICKKYFYNIFNNSLKDTTFPMKLKLADITPTHKSDDVTDKKK